MIPIAVTLIAWAPRRRSTVPSRYRGSSIRRRTRPRTRRTPRRARSDLACRTSVTGTRLACHRVQREERDGDDEESTARVKCYIADCSRHNMSPATLASWRNSTSPHFNSPRSIVDEAWVPQLGNESRVSPYQILCHMVLSYSARGRSPKRMLSQKKINGLAV